MSPCNFMLEHAWLTALLAVIVGAVFLSDIIQRMGALTNGRILRWGALLFIIAFAVPFLLGLDGGDDSMTALKCSLLVSLGSVIGFCSFAGVVRHFKDN